MEHLSVTCVKPNRGFLHIYGHKRPELLDQLIAEISAYKPFIKQIAASNELYPNLEFDTIYLALATETDRYHRCTVREKRPNNKAIVDFIDYGKDYEVETKYLLELDPKNKKSEFLKVFPPIATKYILANFFCAWKTDEISVIRAMLHRAVLPITNEQTDRDFHFISLSFNGIDFATKLIGSHIGLEISFTEQRLEVRRQCQRLCDVFENGPKASPARREKRRNLVPNRPLQTTINNNNTITSQGKRMIQSVVMSNVPNSQRNYMPPESTVVDGIVQSSAATIAKTTAAAAGTAPAPSRVPAFTAIDLSVGPFHAVYCSYVEDGPNLFWVQLKSQEHILDRMASQLANAPRNPITTKVRIGMACMARFSEDLALYRAVIQKIQPDGCRVTFIDYGNSELISYSELYEIPNQFLEHKTFAWSFQLHGCKELDLANKRLIDYFESLVSNDNLLDLKVNNSSNNIQLQQCDLYIANGQSVLNILKDKMLELSTYPAAPILKSGDMVIIRTALTAKRFFVQRLEKMQVFERMMDDLFQFCSKAPQPKTLPTKGSCCAAMAHGDSNEWYRAIVLDILDKQRVQVQFVDYGMEMACSLSELRMIEAHFLELPRQAIECCLVDFEQISDVSESTSKQLSMLIDNSNGEPIPYKANVRHTRRRASNNVYIIDLYDETKDLSVSLSVYKLAMPRRPYNNNKPAKLTTTTTIANDTEKSQRPMPNSRTNGQTTRECDGAESQEKFHETTNAPAADISNDRYSSNKNGNDDSFRSDHAKSTYRNDNTKMEPTHSQPKNYGNNRSDQDNRRYNDQPKRQISQKNIIPRLNKRSNRSRNHHNGKQMIGVDKNDNWDGTMGVDSSHSSNNTNADVSSKSTEKGMNNTPKIATNSTEDCVVNSLPATTTATATVAVAVAAASEQAAVPAASEQSPVPTESVVYVDVDVNVHMPKTNEPIETDPMTSVISSTNAMSIDITAPTPTNETQSTAEMASMTKASSENDSAIERSRELAFITHINHPNQFYMQKNSDSHAIDSLHESLQIVAAQLPALTEFRAGQLCIGKFSLDDCWYRAKIIYTDGEITSIQFIDYGNTDSITDNALLKSPDNTLMAREPYAMECSLPIAPPGNTKEWPENANEKLRMLNSDTPIEYELISTYKDVNYVKLFLVGGRDLMREMIQENVADPLEIIKSGEACYVSHINSLNDFYVQVESDTEVLHKIELHLDQNRDSPILEAPCVGQICSAQFEDDRFYRARILNISPESNHYQVEFLDYGNTFLTTKIHSLNPQIADLPYLRKRCQLQLPNDIAAWNEQAEQQFRTVSAEGATEFKVHLIQPGKTACVELSMDDVNLSTMLGELCEKRPVTPITIDQQKSIASNENASTHSIEQMVNDFPRGVQPCSIVHANSPADFFIHFHDKFDVLDLIAAELAKPDEYEMLDPKTVEIGSIVAALYPDDDCYYRAKVLERLATEINVIFIDYGNVCVVSQLRNLPTMIQPIVPLAVHCTLSNDVLKQFTPADVNGFMGILDEIPEPTFHVQAISTSMKMATVELTRNGQEILDYIRAKVAEDAVAVTMLSDILEEATNMSHE